jgi:HEAT repeat protein
MGYGERIVNSTTPLVPREVAEHLVAAAIGEDQVRCKEALILLGVLGRSMLPFVLLSLEKEEKPETRKRLMAVLGSMGPEIIQETVGRLTDERWYVVQNSLEILGEIARETLDPDLLRSSLQHGDARVRRSAIKILGKLGKKKKCVRILCELLGEKDEETRLLSLRTLGDVGDGSAVSRIVPFLQKRKLGLQKSDVFRKAAIEVLGRIGSSDAIHPLTDLLKSKGFFKKEDDEIRKSVLEALGAIGNPEVEPVIQSILTKETDESIQEAARRALSRIRSPRKGEAS